MKKQEKLDYYEEKTTAKEYIEKYADFEHAPTGSAKVAVGLALKEVWAALPEDKDVISHSELLKILKIISLKT